MEVKPQSQPPKGRIITFYSYKGGTGRSMAVANVAWMLALSGERVLVVDWDLEAPGIHRYFHPFLDDKELLETEGLLDFVERLASRAAVATSPLADEEVDVIEYVKLLKWPVRSSITWRQFGPRAGIDLLVAGRQGPAYSAKLNSFNWIDFYERLNGRQLLRVAQRQLKDVYDYVLVDSRTGVSDTSGICTVDMPDTLVVCFTLNIQSIVGASSVAEWVLAQRQALEKAREQALQMTSPSPRDAVQQRPFRVYPVPMRVEMSEHTKRQVSLEVARERFGQFVDHFPKDAVSQYWGEVQVAYFPFYAFEETPAIFGDVANDAFSLTASVKQVARWVTGEKSLEVVPLAAGFADAEIARKEVLAWYARVPKKADLDPIQRIQAIYDQFGSADQTLMKNLLLRLVQVGNTSIPASGGSTITDLPTALRPMAEKLASMQVLTIANNEVSISDRAVAESWKLLRRWVDDDQSFLMWRQNLTSAARYWNSAGRDESSLLRGRLLDESLNWAEQRPEDLNEIERDFVSESKRATASSGTQSEGAGLKVITLSLKWWSKVGIGKILAFILVFAALLTAFLFGYRQYDLARMAALESRAREMEAEKQAEAAQAQAQEQLKLTKDLQVKIDQLTAAYTHLAGQVSKAPSGAQAKQQTPTRNPDGSNPKK